MSCAPLSGLLKVSLVTTLVLCFLVGYSSAQACTEAEAGVCHATAYCEAGVCSCPEGSVGDGNSATGSGCNRESWSVRVTLDLGSPALTASGERLDDWEAGRAAFTNLFFDAAPKPAWFDTSVYHTVTLSQFATIAVLFETKAEADAALADFNAALLTNPVAFGVNVATAMTTEPRVYTFLSKTSSAEFRILPTGMDVQNVYFKYDCMSSGCWVLDLIYTTGEDNFNVFYLPKAIGDDDLSYDFDYTAIPAYASPYSKSPADTFEPRNFPCGSDGYVPGAPGSDIPTQVSACCIEEFTEMYRPIETFVADTDVTDVLGASRDSFCGAGATRRIYSSSDMPASALVGNFSGMAGLAAAEFKSTEDPFIKQYTATVYLDEVALRTKAGMLTGTVGVEHAIDTFIGLANFKPTGLEFLDMFAMQVNVHLEKTSFFTVATHGENQYTFLEYVNLRLVAIYEEQANGGTVEDGDNMRVDSTGAAHYLQVTFTLGAQYQPIETGIIPIDSVMVSKGDFITSATTEATRFHTCSQYTEATFPDLATFDSRFPTESTQTCAPDAKMCKNPESTPDQFVAFNVPLGIDWLPAASNNLDSNVFVDMVVSVIDTDQIAVIGGNPNAGDAPEQMKTTLTASIPVVEGGVNIFCDGITAATDLLDVANADLIVGSAGYDYEYSRLRIVKDIAKGSFNDQNSTRIDSDSIEAGLMTLVVKGNSSYFGRAGAVANYALEVEDIITIHVMEPESGTKFDAVLGLLFQAGDDNSVNGALDTDGYALNGAFRFTVNRAENRAALEPTDALATLCPFTPQRPSPDDAFPETCVSRRDIRARGFPNVNGQDATAIELPSADVARDSTDRDAVAAFMQTVMGESDYADELGRNFSYIVAQKYDLNGRYMRAFWINPGYEWTPTQTGGTDLFTLSQKLVMFALINLNEGFAGRRRMLLQSATPTDSEEPGAGVSAQQVTFDTTPQSMMASLYNIPEELVATFSVQVQLTHQEACMDPTELRRSIRSTLDDYSSTTASCYETVQVSSVSLNKADVQCNARRNLPRKLLEYSAATATVEMMAVFCNAGGAAAEFNLARFGAMAGVNYITPVVVSDLITTSTAKTYDPSTTHTPSAPGGDTAAGAGSGTNNVQAGVGATPAAEAAPAGMDMMTIAVCFCVGLLAIGAGYFGYKKYQSRQAHEVHVISTVNVADLKGELGAGPAQV